MAFRAMHLESDRGIRRVPGSAGGDAAAMRPFLVLLACAVCSAVDLAVVNPTSATWAAAAIRLPGPLPAELAAGPGTPRLVATRDGRPVPVAAVFEDGGWYAVVRDDLAPRSRAVWRIDRGIGSVAVPAVTVRTVAEGWELDNGRIAVRLPRQGDGGPIAALRVDGRWIGASRWIGLPAGARLAGEVIADGSVVAAVRLRWTCPPAVRAGLAGEVPAFAEVTVRLDPGADHIEIQEHHQLPGAARWEWLVAREWTPDRVLTKPHWQGAGGQSGPRQPDPDRPLGPVDHPAMDPGLVLALVPRWNQHFKDGWRAAFGDGRLAVGAVAVAAGRWVWPHANAVEARIEDGGLFRCPAQRGRRVWWLLAGDPAMVQVDQAYLDRWWLRHPSRIGGFRGDPAVGSLPPLSPFDGVLINPTGHQRNLGKQALAAVGKPAGRDTVWRLQDWTHPDIYGSTWLGWSPENPNFLTDFNTQAIAWAAQVAATPDGAWAAELARARLTEDLVHTVTLPGGAGQECPGYLRHGLDGVERQVAGAAQLGLEAVARERIAAGRAFLRRISQPDGAIRRDLPIGDTHPDRKGGTGPMVVEVPADEVRAWRSTELPGFGAILQHRPGTPRETFLAFKAGSNRGHYHGDQLAVHWSADARPLVVDHHCSYNPRAGQEHMHNRVAFSLPGLPWANLDGHERLTGFAGSELADIAVGEVASPRLRAVAALPPETWHQEFPRHAFAGMLTYRRTVVLVKGGARDYLVLHDRWDAPEPVAATFWLHARAEGLVVAGDAAHWPARLMVRRLAPAEAAGGILAWSHRNGGPEATEAVRWTATAAAGAFITVAWPGDDAPAIRLDGGLVQVGDDRIRLLPGGGAEVQRGSATILLPDSAIDRERSQGDIGLFVPDAGYPFGPLPDWLIRQRWHRPEVPAWAKPLRRETMDP